MDIEDLQQHLDRIMHDHNNQGNPEFEGYSPAEMYQILHFTFGKDSPIQLKKLIDTDYARIPMLSQIRYLANLIAESGELKLTQKGFLPTKIVADIYSQGFLKEEFIDTGFQKLYKETDSITINLTRILIELSGLAKKRNGKLSLTKAAGKILADNHELLKLIITTFATRFNWAYYDGYGENQIGQVGYGFSLILLSKYGHKKQEDSFYAKKYFKAFPQLLVSVEPSHGTVESYSARCYSLRTFKRFLDYFGLIKIEKEGRWLDEIEFVTKTDLFDKLLKCRPHIPQYSMWREN